MGRFSSWAEPTGPRIPSLQAPLFHSGGPTQPWEPEPHLPDPHVNIILPSGDPHLGARDDRMLFK